MGRRTVVKWCWGVRATNCIRATNRAFAIFLSVLVLLVPGVETSVDAASSAPSTVARIFASRLPSREFSRPVYLPYPSGPNDPAEMEAFLDTFISTQLTKYQIPGAAVAVVVDGELFFAKGYGVTDTRSQTPVQADRTLFHAGSVTKLFTWTAVMQLVEQRRLDLHTDINTYLSDFQIPATYPEPITLHHLLTHTPGFEDQLSNLFRFGPNDGLPLDEYVVRKLPARVYPPGEIIGYSNYGAALVGYIIEQVTGMSYEQYIEENILAPLEMHRTTIREPVPAEWMRESSRREDSRSDLALGHYQGLTGPVPLQEYFPSAPVVGLTATVTDIARFMIAHLQDGRHGETRILQAATAQEMHRQQFTHDPRLPGVTYGLVEWARNGQRLLWHGSSTGFFEGMIFLLPEHNVGAFVVYNRKTPFETGREFRQAFLDHYYPVAPKLQTRTGDPALAREFAGAYRESRWSYSRADKFIYMFTRYYTMEATADGQLHLDGVAYVPTEPGVFQAVEGEGTLIFHTGARGQPERESSCYGFYDYDPHKVFIKLAWYETRPFHLSMLIGCALLFVSALIAGPLGRVPVHAPWIIAEARSIFQWVGAFNLLYPVGMLVIGVTVLIDALPDLSFLVPLFIMGLVGGLIVVLFLVGIAWRGRYWSTARRTHYTLVALAGCVFAGWLNYWNLLRLWRF
ncbi:MAG: beta-lactamase family protein [Anaerolineae bacterium]|nr:beta-lactamase family protein [Anaerolineae bacterium]